jgi:hypothetical protein
MPWRRVRMAHFEDRICEILSLTLFVGGIGLEMWVVKNGHTIRNRLIERRTQGESVDCGQFSPAKTSTRSAQIKIRKKASQGYDKYKFEQHDFDNIRPCPANRDRD